MLLLLSFLDVGDRTTIEKACDAITQRFGLDGLHHHHSHRHFHRRVRPLHRTDIDSAVLASVR